MSHGAKDARVLGITSVIYVQWVIARSCCSLFCDETMGLKLNSCSPKPYANEVVPGIERQMSRKRRNAEFCWSDRGDRETDMTRSLPLPGKSYSNSINVDRHAC